ncbi:hypothetical protein AMTR_s00077p00055360 [Amborella trichopoda]|uniref:Uncharacterized protein n=1 Tax=Amborella trichopoda TaxID=13333 RepID=W1P8X4_AMBTC|nr:hypothetical protein AMTR_s00077p00055360 [Amborella trichopoda]
MEENAAAFHTAQNSIQALGRGFDVCSDTRLLYCKGSSGSRIVEIDEEHSKNLEVCEGLIVPNVSREIKSSEEKSEREITGVCRFYECNTSLECSVEFSLGFDSVENMVIHV